MTKYFCIFLSKNIKFPFNEHAHEVSLTRAYLTYINNFILLFILSRLQCAWRELCGHNDRQAICKMPIEIQNYIIPMPPPGIAAGIGFSSLMSVITHSVVRNIPAILAAFSSATRVTLAGSTTPASLRFSYTSLRAL